MLKVVLKYTDCLQDGQNVMKTLSNNRTIVLKVFRTWSMYPRVAVLVKDYDELRSILYQLNCNCHYEVVPVKIKNIKENTK